MSHIKRSNGLLQFSVMGSACILMAVATPAAFAANTGIKPKIYNGTATTTQENPYMVALLQSNKVDAFQAQFCGGSLIAKNWVLTAAHCVVDLNTGKAKMPSAIDVLVNRSVLSASDGERIGVERIVPHQFFDIKTADHDIALIKLKSPVNAKPIELLSEFSDQDGAGVSAKVLGWGNTFESSLWWGWEHSGSLAQATLPIIGNAACQSNINTGVGTITNNKLCAGFMDGNKSACRGDSGGPLVVYDAISKTSRQVGIFSASKGCNSYGGYAIFTRVKNYKNIISDIICTAEEKPAAPVLQVSSNGAVFNFDWNLSDAETHYQLLYSPHGKENWRSIDMGNQTHFSDTLVAGNDYDVKVKANKGVCESSGFANVVRVKFG